MLACSWAAVVEPLASALVALGSLAAIAYMATRGRR